MIQLVYAHGPQGEFGFEQGLPWPHISQDFKNFKARTEGTILVMGSNTFASLPSILEGRKHYVITDPNRPVPLTKDGKKAHVYLSINDFERVLENNSGKDGQMFSIIGGPSILAKSLKYADKIIHTEINAKFFGVDTFLCKRFMSMVRCMPLAEQHSYLYTKYDISEHIRMVDKDFVKENFHHAL